MMEILITKNNSLVKMRKNNNKSRNLKNLHKLLNNKTKANNKVGWKRLLNYKNKQMMVME